MGPFRSFQVRALTGLLFTVALAVVGAAAAPKSYPLKCRGGGMTAIGFQLFANGEGKLTVGFKPGTKPANSGLAPGECSWMDRGLREQEPKSLCQIVKDVFISTTGMDDAKYTPSHLFLIQSVWSKGAPYLE
jgi:hypothetical protein